MEPSDSFRFSQSKNNANREGETNEHPQLIEALDQTSQRIVRKRKTLPEIAPFIASEIPDLLRRTRDIDYVAKDAGMVTSHALAAAVCYLLDVDWQQRRRKLFGVLDRVA